MYMIQKLQSELVIAFDEFMQNKVVGGFHDSLSNMIHWDQWVRRHHAMINCFSEE